MLKLNPPEVDRSGEWGLVPLFQGWAHFCKNVHYESEYGPDVLPHAFIIPARLDWRTREELCLKTRQEDKDRYLKLSPDLYIQALALHTHCE